MDKNLKKALRYLKKYIWLSILTIFMSAIVSASNAAPVWFIQLLIDKVLKTKDYKTLYIIAFSMLFVSIIKGFSMYIKEYYSSYISNSIIYDVRKDMFSKLQDLSMKFYKKTELGELVAKFINDAEKFQTAINKMFQAIPKVLTILILLGKVFLIDWKLAIVALCIMPLLSTIMKKFSKKLKNRGKTIQVEIGSITSYLTEIISGMFIVKAFASEEYEINRFKEKNTANLNAAIRSTRVKARVTPIVDFFNTILVIGIMIYGGVQLINDNITSGELFAFLTALGLIYEPLRSLVSTYNDVLTSKASIDRVMEILDYEVDIKESEHPILDFNSKGDVKLKDVCFKYEADGKEILKNINIEAKEGEIIALVGQSGSGKTTLVNLIPRFYDVDSGEVLVDGINIKDIAKKSLRENIAIVPQDTFLFSGTIYDNICYGTSGKTTKEIENAAKMANAFEFIKELPNGFNTEVGERGVLLSGGQKQRISIARALLKNPKILILDEATSALDTESEKLVQEALDKLMNNRTTFVIAHRLSTIFHADKIIVMKNGEVIEMGKHIELIQKDGAYKKLYDTQFK